MSKNIAIIFAGGSGARMGSGLPKQFIEINGKPIIIHTLENFEDHPQIDAIYIACKKDYVGKLEKLVQKHMIEKTRKIIEGGNTAMESAYKALKTAENDFSKDDIVLIHDGVRPYITSELISDNIASVKENGNAVTCTAMYETPIVSDNGQCVDQVMERDKFFTAQAPQSFFLGDIIGAHEKIRSENPDYTGIVDACTLVRATGKEVSIVEGNRGNIKITTPEDLYLFRGLLQYKETSQAYGLTEKEIPDVLKK